MIVKFCSIASWVKSPVAQFDSAFCNWDEGRKAKNAQMIFHTKRAAEATTIAARVHAPPIIHCGRM